MPPDIATRRPSRSAGAGDLAAFRPAPSGRSAAPPARRRSATDSPPYGGHHLDLDAAVDGVEEAGGQPAHQDVQAPRGDQRDAVLAGGHLGRPRRRCRPPPDSPWPRRRRSGAKQMQGTVAMRITRASFGLGLRSRQGGRRPAATRRPGNPRYACASSSLACLRVGGKGQTARQPRAWGRAPAEQDALDRAQDGEGAEGDDGDLRSGRHTSPRSGRSATTARSGSRGRPRRDDLRPRSPAGGRCPSRIRTPA